MIVNQEDAQKKIQRAGAETGPTLRSSLLAVAAAAAVVPGLLLVPRLLGARAHEPAGGAPSRASTAFPLGTLTAALSGDKVLRRGAGEVYLSVDLTAQPASGAGRPPVDLALVIDRSGSMMGQKLEAARRAAKGIIARLADGDRAALIQYDDTAEVLVELTPLDVQGRTRLAHALDEIRDRGGTNLHGGMVLGQRELLRDRPPGRVNRVVLLSDGQANQGITDEHTLGTIAAAAADQGVRLSAVGIGLGFNEDLMELLAEHGRGRYHYVKDADSLDAVLADELSSLQATVASSAELRLVPARADVEIVEVYGYEIRRHGSTTVVPLVDLSGGDSRRLVARVRVPDVGAGRADLVRVELAYTDARSRRPGGGSVALGAELSDDAQAVQQATDREVMAHVVQMEAASAMRSAAVAYERGDRQSARTLLQSKQTQMRSLARKLALDEAKVNQALHELPQFAGEIDRFDPGTDAGKHSLKLHKAGARSQMKAKW